MSNHESPTATSISRWRTARGIVLGAIILAGSMATSAAVMYRLADQDCGKRVVPTQQKVAERGFTYSGIGAVIQQHGPDRVMIRHVLPNGPAEGLIQDGSYLISVNGETPRTLQGWADALRGPAGSQVEVEVASCANGHRTVTLTRGLIHMRR